MATPPRCVAGSVDRPPPSLPIGVRALLRITVRGMRPSLLTCASMRVTATTDAPPATDADTIVVGVFEDEGIAHDHGGVLQALVDSGEAKRGLRKLAVTHAEGRRYIVAGLGGRARLRPRAGARGRGGASSGARRSSAPGRCAGRCRTTSPTPTSAALVEGTLLAAYTLPRVQASRRGRRGLEALILSAHHDVSAAGGVGRDGRRGASTRARDLQNRAGQRADADARWPSARGELDGRERRGARRRGDRGRGHGRVRGRRAGLRRGAAADHDPLRAGRRHRARCSGFVGKAVTFDSGGISIKPAAKMHEMKFDMSRRRRGARGRRRDRRGSGCPCASRA